MRVSAFTDYLGGSRTRPDGAEEFLAGVRQSLSAIPKVRSRKLVISTAQLHSRGLVAHTSAPFPRPLRLRPKSFSVR